MSKFIKDIQNKIFDAVIVTSLYNRNFLLEINNNTMIKITNELISNGLESLPKLNINEWLLPNNILVKIKLDLRLKDNEFNLYQQII